MLEVGVRVPVIAHSYIFEFRFSFLSTLRVLKFVTRAWNKTYFLLEQKCDTMALNPGLNFREHERDITRR